MEGMTSALLVVFFSCNFCFGNSQGFSDLTFQILTRKFDNLENSVINGLLLLERRVEVLENNKVTFPQTGDDEKEEGKKQVQKPDTQAENPEVRRWVSLQRAFMDEKHVRIQQLTEMKTLLLEVETECRDGIENNAKQIENLTLSSTFASQELRLDVMDTVNEITGNVRYALERNNITVQNLAADVSETLRNTTDGFGDNQTRLWVDVISLKKELIATNESMERQRHTMMSKISEASNEVLQNAQDDSTFNKYIEDTIERQVLNLLTRNLLHSGNIARGKTFKYPHHSYGDRRPENVVDGDVETCFYIYFGSHLWLSIDFGSEAIIKKIVFKTNLFVSKSTTKVTVRASESDTLGKDCGQLEEMYVYEQLVTTVVCSTPLIGRIIYVDSPSYSRNDLCEIEVYSVE